MKNQKYRLLNEIIQQTRFMLFVLTALCSTNSYAMRVNIYLIDSKNDYKHMSAEFLNKHKKNGFRNIYTIPIGMFIC